MKKALKINHALLTIAIVLITVQLGIIIWNMLSSDLPWTSADFIQGSLLYKAVILVLYFALGAAAAVCAVMAFVVAGEKKQLTARQSVNKLALCAMFLALYIVIQAASIDITAWLRITFNFLMFGAVGMFFGPGTGAVFGVAADILGYMVHTGVGGFFPAFTLIAAIKGIVYGVGLYRGPLHQTQTPPSLARVAIVKAVDSIVCNLLLNTAAQSFLYGKGFFLILPERALKNLILYPLETALLYFLLKTLYNMNKKLKTKF